MEEIIMTMEAAQEAMRRGEGTYITAETLKELQDLPIQQKLTLINWLFEYVKEDVWKGGTAQDGSNNDHNPEGRDR